MTQLELDVAQVQPSEQRMQVSLPAELPPEHTKPLSTEHTPLQPSPAAVFPSSHASEPTRLPSPQAVAQNWALVLATVYVLPG